MANQTRAQLTTLLNSKVLSGGNRTTAQNIRDFENAIIESLINHIDDVDQNNGYLGIDSFGKVNIAFIKKTTPTGQFLRDDGTWQTVSTGSVDLQTVLNNGNSAIEQIILKRDLDNTAYSVIGLDDTIKVSIGNSTDDAGYVYFNDSSEATTVNIDGESGSVSAKTVNITTETANTIASFGATKNVKSLPLSTYPSLTELSYAKGVTSDIQTQLNAKQATLVSGTNIKTVNGSTLLGSSNLQVGNILGTIGATTGLIALGTGTADTVTTLSGFSYTTSTFLANPSTSTQITIGSTATNAMIRLDSAGLRVGNLSTAGTANTVSFQVGTKFLVTDSSSMAQLGTAATGQFQMQTSFFGSGSGVLSTMGSFMGGNGTRGSMAFAPSADLANVGDKVLFAYHTGSAWASAIEYANASAANVIVSLVSAGGRVGIATASSHSRLHVNGSLALGYVAKTSAYTATISDYVIDCTSGTFNVTLPTAVGITGRIYEIVNSGAGIITLATTSSQTFVNVTATPITLTIAAALGSSVRVMSNGANWIQLN